MPMTRRERMLAAIRREPVDRVPFCTYNLYPYMDSRHAQDASYRDLLALVEQKAGMFCKAGGARRKDLSETELRTEQNVEQTPQRTVTTTVIHTPKGDLQSVRVSPEDQPGYVTEALLKTDGDIEKFLSLPYAPPEYDISRLVEFERQLGERGVVCVSYADPMCSAASLFDFEDFAIRCVTRPQEVGRLIDFLFERIAEETRRLVRACRGHLFVFHVSGPELATPPLLPPRLFPQLVTSYQRRLIEIIHEAGQLAAIHCHGRVRQVLDEIIATGADALEPIEPPPQGDITLEELLEKADGRMALIGHIQDQEFHTAPPGTLTKRVEDIARLVRGRTGYIMSPTCTPFQHPAAPTFLRNYTEWLEAAARILG
jgi:uroporphyrinogen-III decarboxylase